MPPASWTPLLRRAFPLALAIVASCATERPLAPADAPLAEALAAHGTAEFFPGAAAEEVVVVRDRHYVGGGITFVDDDLRTLQREHGRLVADLVGRDFGLMGAEWRRGPLPDDDVAEAHREAAREALETGDDLNRRSIYQPIRYEVEFAGRLAVVGVEDPEMYDADVSALDVLTELSRLRRRHDTTDGPSDAEIERRWNDVRRAMRARTAPRGREAAKNLLAAMRDRGVRRAILLIGAAHVPAVAEGLRAEGVPHYVFTARSFARRAERTDLR